MPYEFNDFSDALRKIDDQVEGNNYKSAMKTCSAAISFFNAYAMGHKVLKTKMKIIKTLNKGVLTDESTPPCRPK